MFGKEGLILLFVQLSVLILFYIFCTYKDYQPPSDYNQEKYGMFQDIHVMIFIGFGFLMSFLKNYGYSAVGFNFLIGAITLQCSILIQGFTNLSKSFKIEIGLDSLYQADCAVATILISMGAVLGRTSYTQLLLMAILGIVFYSGNSYLNLEILKISDAGGSILIHTFGAYYGVFISYVLNFKNTKLSTNSSYYSDLQTMIGTLFLWLYWPSFNSIALESAQKQRAVINTYLSLIGSCVTAFLTSHLLSENKKFRMTHIQNSTLAGGVAVGASANLMVTPFGAIMIGSIAGAVSVFGYSVLNPIFESSFQIYDTCGVQFLHGMPGILGGAISIIMAFFASNEDTYTSKKILEIYPDFKNDSKTYNSLDHNDTGLLRPPEKQAIFQALGLTVTLGVAAFSGLFSGLVLKWTRVYQLKEEVYYKDQIYWELPPEQTNTTLVPFIIRKNTKNFDLITIENI